MSRKKWTRTFELTVERSEYFTAPEPRAVALAWCAGCGGRARFVTPQEAAAASGASLRALFRRIEAAEVHFVETSDGRLLVCLASLEVKGRGHEKPGAEG